MKILGMGNALVDIVIHLPDDNILVELELPKASMQLIDMDRLYKIQRRLSGLKQELASGGSAANTIHGLSALGVETGFIGSVGKDEYGDFFHSDIEGKGISGVFSFSGSPSGRAMALVSPDSERTFGTFLGAALELGSDHINESLFDGYDLLHIEGYLVQNHDLIEKALRVASEKGLEVSIDLASYNVVEENRDFLERVLTDYVTIVFANEEESIAMTGHDDPDLALESLYRMCSRAVVKLGGEGSIIMTPGGKVKVEAVSAVPVDTSGAGDLYASGFLYGMSKGLDYSKCGHIGSLLASNVIRYSGPKLPHGAWDELLLEVARIEEGF